jgi:hypothetical protein
MATAPQPMSLVEQDLCHRLTTKLMRLDDIDRQRREIMSDIQADSKALASERGMGFLRLESIRLELGVHEPTKEQR